MKRTAIVLLLLVCVVRLASAQGAQPQNRFVPLDKVAGDLKRTLSGNTEKAEAERIKDVAELFSDWTQDLAVYSLGRSLYASLIEENRVDKQVGTSSSTAGSTSLVSHGSVPALIGLAMEGGGLYQSTNGNVVTLRLNPSGVIRALAKSSYWSSVPPKDAALIEQALSRVSLSASFDLSQGASPGVFTADRSQLREGSLRIEIWNKRDPRDQSHAAEIGQLRANMATLVSSVQDYFTALRKVPGYSQWQKQWAERLTKVVTDDDAVLEREVFAFGDDFAAKFGASPEFQRISGSIAAAIRSFRTERDRTFEGIAKSSALSFEYAYNRLSLADDALATLSAGTVLPDLSTGRIVFASPFPAAEVTFNGSVTFFNTRQANGHLRDAQLSGSVDFHVGNLPAIGKPVVTLAVLGAWLQQQPFGTPVTVQGISTSDGAIGVFQAKVTLPTNGGVRIPISFTIASRSEFNTNEREVRGAIGLTFDFDKLFVR